MMLSNAVLNFLFRRAACAHPPNCLRKRYRKFPIVQCLSTVPTSQQVEKSSRSHDNNIVHSRYDIGTVPDCSFCEYIFPVLEKHGQKEFLIDGITGKSYSFHDVLMYSEKVASGLKKLGLQKSDIVAIYSVNRPENIIAWLAVVAAGGIVTEVNPVFKSGELQHQLNDTKAAFLIAGSECVSTVQESLKNLPLVKKIVVFGEAAGFLPFSQLMLDDGELGRNIVQVQSSTVAHIPYSSGTTGLPKGVMVSHKGVAAGAMSAMHEVIRMSTYNDTSIILLPFFHIYGNFMMWCNAFSGCTSVILPRFTPETLLSCIQKYRGTFLPVVPPLVLFLIQSPLVKQYDLSSLKSMMCGAAPVSTEHMEQISQQFGLECLRQGYGMTEACPIAMTPTGQSDNLISVGHPVSGMSIKIVDTSTGQNLNLGDRGEICLKSDFQMLGYFGNPKATAATIDSEGWVHTGDIGYIDENQNLYVVDRLKELIKYKGHQVAPAELEALLLTHPSVKDVAVISVPDERAGELPRAYIVLDSSAKNISEDDIKNFVAGQASDEKHLRGGVIFIDQIPKSSSGKILRKDLKTT